MIDAFLLFHSNDSLANFRFSSSVVFILPVVSPSSSIKLSRPISTEMIHEQERDNEERFVRFDKKKKKLERKFQTGGVHEMTNKTRKTKRK